MEVKIIEESKNKLIFDVIGESHTVLGALKKELWNDSSVKATGYNMPHPLLLSPRFIVETSGEDPKKVLNSAIKKLEKNVEKLQEQASKEF